MRRPFNEEVAKRCVAFANDLLLLVPELECVAIVPSFNPVPERVPSGFIVGRTGEIRTPQEIVNVAAQLHLALRSVMDSSFKTLRAVDERMSQQAQEIKKRAAELAEIERAVAEHRGADAAGAGNRGAPDGTVAG